MAYIVRCCTTGTGQIFPQENIILRLKRKMSRKILIIGGRGALGSALVSYFRAHGFYVASVVQKKNVEEGVASEADLEIKMDHLQNAEEKQASIQSALLASIKFDAIICAAGGWSGGNVSDPNFLKNASLSWDQSVKSSLLASSLARIYLQAKGTLVLVGAAAAKGPTPQMIGYGMAKASVHHLTKSLGAEGSGLTGKSIAILPQTLDTPNNRKWMPDADFGAWTPLIDIARLIHSWIEDPDGIETPKSGDLVILDTQNGKTQIEIM